MKIITLSSLKGGVGKSLISFNLGGFLYSKGNKVLLIDLDTQCNTTKNMTYPTNRGKTNYELSVVDIMEAKKSDIRGKVHPKDIVIKNPRLDYPGFDLLPSNKNLSDAEAKLLSTAPLGFHVKFQNWIAEFQSELEAEYDYIIIDVSPYFGAATLNALYVADEIFLITDSSENAIDGVNDLNRKWNEICETINHKNNIKGIIANNIDTRQGSAKEFVNSLFKAKDKSIVPIFTSYIKNSSKIKDSEFFGPVALSDSADTRNNLGPKSLYKAFEDIMKEGYL